MEGLIELAEEVFHMPVRLGMPQFVKGLSDVVRNPIYATGVGLLLYGHQQSKDFHYSPRTDGGLSSIIERMKSWFSGF